MYIVAGTDWEFEQYGGYARAEWGLRPEYDLPYLMREVIEDYLTRGRPVSVTMGRLE